MLLQCPQETRAPAGWGSGLAGPGWTGPRLIILLLERDGHTKSTFYTTKDSRYYSARMQANNHRLMLWADVSYWRCGKADDSFTFWDPSAANSLITTNTIFLLSSDNNSSSESLIRQQHRRVWFSQHVWFECKTVTVEVNSLEQFNAGKVTGEKKKTTFWHHFNLMGNLWSTVIKPEMWTETCRIPQVNYESKSLLLFCPQMSASLPILSITVIQNSQSRDNIFKES